MPTDTPITELDELTAEKVSGVATPANGIPFLVLKAADEKGFHAADTDSDEADEILAEVTKAAAMGFCGTDDCDICAKQFGPIGELLKRKLKAADRRALPDSDFAIPEKAPQSGSYPINDESHARNALSRASGKPVEARVKAAVHRKYPNIGADAKKEDGPTFTEAAGTPVPLSAIEQVEKSPGVPDFSVATPTENGHIRTTGVSGLAGPATAGVANAHTDPTYALGGEAAYKIPANDKAFTVANPPWPEQRNRPDGLEVGAEVAAEGKHSVTDYGHGASTSTVQQPGGASKDGDWEIEVVDKADWLAMNNPVNGMATSNLSPSVGSSATPAGTLAPDASSTPGSPAWEAYDSATLDGAARGLAAAARMVDQIGKREVTEAMSGEASDWFDAMQLGCAADDINQALCLVAGLAYHEMAAEKGAAEKAGRKLSANTAAALRAARDHLTDVLGDGKSDQSAGPGHRTESDEIMTTVTKEELAALVSSAAKDAALEAVKADRKARKEERKAKKNANNGGDIDDAGLHAGMNGTADADDVRSINPGSPAAGVTKSQDEDVEELRKQVGALKETLEKVVAEPRHGGPVLDGMARGSAPAAEGRQSTEVAKSEHDVEVERLQKEFDEYSGKPGIENSHIASNLSQELTLAKIRRARAQGYLPG